VLGCARERREVRRWAATQIGIGLLFSLFSKILFYFVSKILLQFEICLKMQTIFKLPK
jgi:hypothetical protein